MFTCAAKPPIQEIYERFGFVLWFSFDDQVPIGSIQTHHGTSSLVLMPDDCTVKILEEVSREFAMQHYSEIPLSWPNYPLGTRFYKAIAE